MNLFEQLISEGMIKAIYLTLFHSLWQGALIAAVAGVIMLGTKKSSAAWRYNLLLCSLLLFVSCVVYTFIGKTEKVAISTFTINTGEVKSAVTAANLVYAATQTTARSFGDQTAAFFNAHATAIVIFWFMVICFKCSQLIIGLYGTTKMRNKQIFPSGDIWENKLRNLASSIGINQYIRLAQSGLAQVPMTIGYFKPIILVPVGFFAAIPQDQVEAILLHELAHIRRKDYLMNIMQSMVEILFFFNPAIWWLSSLLRAERENCCDDIAISKTNNKSIYINALVSFEEYRGSLPQYASAVTGSKNHLLNRAKRLIYNHNKTLNPMEKILLTCGLVITGMLSVAFTQIEKHVAKKHIITEQTINRDRMISAADEKSEAERQSVAVLDTTKKTGNSYTSINTSMDGKQYRMVAQNGVITELYVDNVRIADNKIADYKNVTDKLMASSNESKLLAEKSKALAETSKMVAEDSKRQAEKARVMAEQHVVQSKATQQEAKQMAEKMKAAAEDFKKQAEGMRVSSEKMQQQAKQLSIQQAEISKQQVSKLSQQDFEKQEAQMKLQQESIEKQMKAIKIQAEEMKEKAEKMRQDLEKTEKSGQIKITRPLYNPQPQIVPVKPIEPVRPDYVNSKISYQPKRISPVRNVYGENILQELINEGVIKDKNVAFHITNDVLTVDGVNQSDELRNKILSKVMKNSTGTIDLTYSSSVTTKNN